MEYLGHLRTQWHKSYVVKLLSESSYKKIGDNYCVFVDYQVLMNGVPQPSSFAILDFKTEEEAKQVKVGSVMPKEYWVLSSSWSEI